MNVDGPATLISSSDTKPENMSEAHETAPSDDGRQQSERIAEHRIKVVNFPAAWEMNDGKVSASPEAISKQLQDQATSFRTDEERITERAFDEITLQLAQINKIPNHRHCTTRAVRHSSARLRSIQYSNELHELMTTHQHHMQLLPQKDKRLRVIGVIGIALELLFLICAIWAVMSAPGPGISIHVVGACGCLLSAFSWVHVLGWGLKQLAPLSAVCMASILAWLLGLSLFLQAIKHIDAWRERTSIETIVDLLAMITTVTRFTTAILSFTFFRKSRDQRQTVYPPRLPQAQEVNEHDKVQEEDLEAGSKNQSHSVPALHDMQNEDSAELPGFAPRPVLGMPAMDSYRRGLVDLRLQVASGVPVQVL
jgi:multisubunit Na+/H+ antiporter MnhB subunit